MRSGPLQALRDPRTSSVKRCRGEWQFRVHEQREQLGAGKAFRRTRTGGKV